MNRVEAEQSFSLMNTAVVLVILIPLLLLMWEQSLRATAPDPPENNDQPPILIFSEAEGYSFPSGKADLAPEFERLLTGTIVTKLEKLAWEYRCDIIEVIGHTDEQPINRLSNLDAALLPILNGGEHTLMAGSNADLGLMRAWSVILFLKADQRLAGKTFHGYSAGQTLLPDGSAAPPTGKPQDESARRRIEIRLRRSNKRE